MAECYFVEVVSMDGAPEYDKLEESELEIHVTYQDRDGPVSASEVARPPRSPKVGTLRARSPTKTT